MMSSSSEKEEYYEEIQLGLDIEIEILKRLPPKSLVRFTSVSKEWKSIIRSSPFISDYSNIQQQQTSDLFFLGFNLRNFAIIKEKQPNNLCNDVILTLPVSDDNFRDFDSCCELIGYSQGLFGFFNRKDRLVIWNPAIRKSLFIPLPPDHARSGYDYFCFTVVCNATEPTIFYTTKPHYSSITEEARLQVLIYTLSAGAWRTVSYTPPRKSFCFIGQPKVTDMYIYWIVYTRNDDDSWIYVIMSFDITNEQITYLCLPPALAIQRDTYNTLLDLSKLRESLVVLEIDEIKQEIGVWMMKKETGGVEHSFTKQFTVNLADSTNQRRYWKIWEVKVLGFTIDGQIILQMEVYGHTWQLFYEPDSKSFIDIGKGKPPKTYSHLAASYMETLLLLDH